MSTFKLTRDRIRFQIMYTFIRYIAFVLAILTMVSIPVSVIAQTRFEWVNDNFDVAQYKYAETCVSAYRRMLQVTRGESKIDVDTLHVSMRLIKDSISQTATHETKRCLARFNPQSIPLKDAFFMQRAYLLAGEDAKAAEVMERRIRSISRDSTAVLVAALDTAFLNYTRRLEHKRIDGELHVIALSEELADVVPLEIRVKFAASTVQSALDELATIDTVRLTFDRLVTLAKSMNDEEWFGPLGLVLAIPSEMALERLHESKLLESLAQSTQAYRDILRTLFVSELGREHAWLVQREELVGSEAPPIRGDYWFPAGTEKESFPRQGRVTLVISVAPTLSGDDGSWFGPRNAVIRRMKENFPELDIVLVGKTAGFFGPIAPPLPELEAQMFDSLFMKLRGLPATVSVTRTDFIKLPPPDGRRVNQPTENEMNGYAGDAVILIDKEGKKTGRTILSPNRYEEEFAKRIAVLLKRPESTR